MDNMEVLIMGTKESRDAVFEGLKATGTPLEKQAAKFSEPVLSGELDARGRLAYVTGWGITYPRS